MAADLRRVGICAATLLVAGCAIEAPPLPDRAEAPEFYAQPVEAEYRIQVSDVLTIRSYYDPTLDQEVTVRPDGRVSLLFMGDVAVAGKTPTELSDEIVKAYQRVVDTPEITVSVKDMGGLGVFLGGEVRTPSVQPVRGPVTVMESVIMAGGFLPTAAMSDVLLIRKDDDGELEVFKLDAQKILANEAPDPYVHRRDIVYVPKTPIAKADQFVEQYINSIIPRAVLTTFGLYSQTGALTVK